MIEELMILSFSKFGMPVYFNKSDFTANYTRKKYHVLPNESQRMFRYTSEVFVEPAGGMGVIYVLNDAGYMKQFLLDKKIRINSGVWMCIAAYNCEFVFHTYAISNREFQSDGELYTAKPLTPQVHVDHLLTAMYQDKGLDFNLPVQQYPFWEFVYMDKGGMECVAGGNMYQLSQGECLFFPPGQVHSIHAADSRSFSFYNVTFEMEYDGKNLTDKILHADANAYKILKRMIEETHREQEFTVDILCASMSMLCVQLLRAQDEKVQSIPISSTLTRNSLNTIVEKCINLIDENISGDLSVPQLSKYLNVSSSYLSKVFRDETNTSLSEYIRDYRLEKSKQLIREGKYSLSQIADMLGYCSIHYFSAQFKTRYGIPPREYSRAAHQD